MSNGERSLDAAVRKWPNHTLVEIRIDFNHHLYLPLEREIYMREGRVIEVLHVWSARDLRWHHLSEHPSFWRNFKRWWKMVFAE
jgi:hypothetical protein